MISRSILAVGLLLLSSAKAGTIVTSSSGSGSGLVHDDNDHDIPVLTHHIGDIESETGISKGTKLSKCNACDCTTQSTN